MFRIDGTKHKNGVTDFAQRCSHCGKLMYFSHDCNRKWVKCPYCGNLQ